MSSLCLLGVARQRDTYVLTSTVWSCALYQVWVIRIILIQIQDVKKFVTDPDPGKNDTDPDPGKKDSVPGKS